MRTILISLILLFSFVAFGCIETKTTENNNSCAKTDLDNNKFDCFIEYFCAGEVWNTVKCQIILNDTVEVFRIQNRDQSSYSGYTQLRLNKRTADCFKSLLLELYSEQNTALKEGIPNERDVISSTQDDLSISLTIGGKEINEFFHITDILYSHKDFDPFRPQFYKIRELINAIILKVEDEKDKSQNKAPITPDWITEKFHDEYYEATNEINTTYKSFPI